VRARTADRRTDPRWHDQGPRRGYTAAVRASFALAVLVGSAASSQAQPAPSPTPAPASTSASELAERGRLLAQAWLKSHDANKLTEATALFKQSLALADDPKVECDLGLALFYLGQPARAQARMTRCLPRLAAANPDRVVRYREVEPEIAAAVARDHVPIDIVTTPPDAVISIDTFPDDETLIAPTRVWLPVGRHTLRAQLDGRADATWSTEVTEADARDPAPRSWRATLRPATTPTSPARPRRSRTPAYVTLGAAGALLAGGAVVHVLGRDVRSELATLSGDAYDDKLDTWHLYQRSTIGLYAAGAIAAGVGTWLWLRARPLPVTVGPAGADGGVMVWWTAP
jgi:hypothetical protein